MGLQAKCERYLPTNVGDSERYGEMEVQVVKQVPFDGYEVRDVLLKVYISKNLHTSHIHFQKRSIYCFLISSDREYLWLSLNEKIFFHEHHSLSKYEHLNR